MSCGLPGAGVGGSNKGSVIVLSVIYKILLFFHDE